ncbi:unnamed protein product [Meloidogyne enterolobii]|uniref:Uncharacterized protein n=1 Tax=Meloidogyne enterolobii TaxID=390850 RepID=A0ACB0YDL8_MELEN
MKHSEISDPLLKFNIGNVPPNPLLDRRRSSGSIPVFSNNEGQHNLFKGEESARHQSFGAQPKNISNIRFSQEIPSYTMQNNPIGNTFNVPQQSVMLMPDKEHQKQKKKESAGFGIEEKPIHECDACGKRLCSSRSLKRHKSTCKRVKAVTEQLQGDFGSPPPPKPENILENKVKDQQNVQKQIRKISGANQISNDNKNNEKVNLTQPVLRQSSSESINSQSFVLSQPSLASNNSSPIKFCTNSDSQNCGGLSSPPLVIQQQQQFYSRQPSYSSAQIQVLKQENDSKKDMEIPFKLTPVTAVDEPNKVSDVVDSVVAKLRSQNSGISGRIPTNCNTNTCNISTNNSQQQQFLPPPQHFNVPIEWNETNMPIQQFCESQQLAAPTMLYYTPVSHQQQQQHLQQRQQQFSGDINNQHGIVPNQIEQTKCPQSKPLMPPIQQQHSWQPMNPPNLQISQQPQPILAAQRNNSTENTNLLPTMLNESSTTNTMNERAEKFPCQYNNNEQIKKQQEGQNNSGNVKNVLTECQTEKLPNSMGIKSTILSSPTQQQPPQRADIGNTSKNVYRYLCPECDKPYSCRKNVKRHRISQHKVPAQEAQDGQIKRIRLTEADLQKDGNKSKQANNKPKEIKKEEIGKEQQNKLKEKELSSDGMSRQNSTTSLTSPTRPHILQSPEHQQNQQQPFVAPLQKQQQIFQKQPPMQIIRDEKQYQTQQRHPYYLPYPPINQSQQEQRFVGQQLLDEQQQQTFYEIPQHQQQYIQHQHQYNYQQQQQNLLYLDSQQQNKKYQQQQQYYSSQMISYPPPPPPPPQAFQQQQPQQKIIMVQQQQQPGPSHSNNNNRLNTFYSQNNYPQQYTTIINNQNNEYPITYQEGYYQQQQQIEQQRQFVTYNNNSFAETLDCWEQIKSDVDTGPAAVVDADAVEMARIVEDLKRTEEVTEKRQQVRIVQQQQTIKRQQKQQNLQFRQLDTGMIVGSESVINADNSSEMFQQNPNIQRKAVELAEADTTFSPPSQPDDSLSRQISHQSHQDVGTQQYQQKMIPLNHHHQIQQSSTTYHPQPLLSASHSTGQQQIFRFDVASVNRAPKELNSVEHEKFQQIEWNYQGGINVIPSQNKYLPQPPPTQQQQTIQQTPSFSTNISQENNLIINKLPTTTQKLTKGESLPKNKTTKATQQSTGTFVCPACTKAYSTDYSLKRHRNVCPVLNVGKELGKGRGNSTRKRKNTNSNNIPTSSTNNMETVKSLEKVVGETRMDEPHQIDPDSTM